LELINYDLVLNPNGAMLQFTIGPFTGNPRLAKGMLGTAVLSLEGVWGALRLRSGSGLSLSGVEVVDLSEVEGQTN
jgi:hypothetical protein